MKKEQPIAPIQQMPIQQQPASPNYEANMNVFLYNPQPKKVMPAKKEQPVIQAKEKPVAPKPIKEKPIAKPPKPQPQVQQMPQMPVQPQMEAPEYCEPVMPQPCPPMNMVPISPMMPGCANCGHPVQPMPYGQKGHWFAPPPMHHQGHHKLEIL